MAEGGGDLGPLAGADPAGSAWAGLESAWQQWLAEQNDPDPRTWWDQQHAQHAFRSGWRAGVAYLAHRIAGEIGVTVVPAAAPGLSEEEPDDPIEPSWDPGPECDDQGGMSEVRPPEPAP